MAVASLHNVPVLESSMIRDSQSLLGRVNRDSIGTRASSILKMWRELEEECAVNRARERGSPRLCSFRGGKIRGSLEDLSESENGSLVSFKTQRGCLNEFEDRQSVTSPTSVQSQDFEEVDRKRVRKVFREWMGSGGNADKCVGDDEPDKVRVVRDWIQMSSQRRGDKVAEIASQIEQDCNKVQLGNSRRRFRKLCGRQALLDLLAKKEQERREELRCLERIRPVSGFPHRNRIQSFLRLRCYQNRRSIEIRRPSSAAESELGLLRQRQTVSGLREGFLSRLDSKTRIRARDLSDGSSDNDSSTFGDDWSQMNKSNEILDSPRELNGLSTEALNVAHEGNVDVAALTPPPCINGGSSSHHSDAELEAVLDVYTDNSVKGRPETATSVSSKNSSSDGFNVLNFQVPLWRKSGEFTVLDGKHGIVHEQESKTDETNVHNELFDQIHVSENLNSHESSVNEYDVSEYGREWESAICNQWGDNRVETGSLHWPGDVEGHSHGSRESEVEERNDMQENYWHEDGSQETPRDWLGMDSGPRTPFDRVDANYFSDDDNVRHIELRELVNRKRVSSLLHSDFRQRLDHLIQAYMERQTITDENWELHEMSPPFVSGSRELLHTDQESESDDTLENESETTLPPPTPPPLPQAHWGQRTHQTNWSRQEIHQHPGTELGIINDLRIDMAGIEQKLNDMQRMLEACMDMQLELQRSVRQEVSAALNRSVNPSESLENVPPKDSFKWDCVRKGVCCICSNTNIDSLLYSCGHMCTCTNCADVLVQGNGKCPMCQAPVNEVIRAYFIQ
ncbi:hypothetical protein RND81_11G110000 [Saponaria officinalis]|uniref:RING-type domain-containing protein n=1 Tax=Saponaria officinalis TaxID=3572 RepID=A0AAW1HL09_SAPOF